VAGQLSALSTADDTEPRHTPGAVTTHNRHRASAPLTGTPTTRPSAWRRRRLSLRRF